MESDGDKSNYYKKVLSAFITRIFELEVEKCENSESCKTFNWELVFINVAANPIKIWNWLQFVVIIIFGSSGECYIFNYHPPKVALGKCKTWRLEKVGTFHLSII